MLKTRVFLAIFTTKSTAMFTTLIDAPRLLQLHTSPDWVIIDCRFSLADTHAGRAAYEEAHIPGAYYAHLDTDLSGPIIAGKTGRHPLPDIPSFAARCGRWGIDDSKQVIVYDDKGGAIASRLWWMLRWLGHEKVAVLDGGWQAWLAEGGTTSADIPDFDEDTAFQPDVNPYWLVNATFVQQAQHDNDYLIVDSRASARYAGENEPIDPIAGHIPGAINAPFAENWVDNFEFKSISELADRFTNILGSYDADHTIFYCGSGVTACHNLLALAHAGLGMAKLYAGSWSDWITRPERGIAKEG
jgi:thiosulfate/3-mercaptopyruvate sulfurtransferase